MTRKLCISSILAITVGFAGNAHAQRFSSVVVFGDSLSDTGNVAQIRELGVGRAATTNPDPVWSDIVSRSFGTSAAHSLAGGTNYAYGGACVTDSCGDEVPALGEQVTAYLSSRRSGRADPDALYSVIGGVNDIFRDQATSDSVIAAAKAHAVLVRRLHDAGARYILVGNAPIPAEILNPAEQEAHIELVRTYNKTLANALRSRENGIVPINLHAFFNEIYEDFEMYGLVNALDPACGEAPPGHGSEWVAQCGPEDYVAPNANRTYFVADATGHPTGAGHAMIANVVMSTLAAPVQVSLAGEAGVNLARSHGDAVLSEQISDFDLDRPVGSWRGFVTGHIGRRELDAAPRLGETKADFQMLTLGALYRVAPRFSAGGALSLGRQDDDIAGASLESTATIVSLYGSWVSGGLYLSGAVSGGETRVDIDRSISLGSAERTERGSTNATQWGANLDLGWNLAQSEGRRHGPFVGLAWMDQKVNGYKERGSSSTSMNFADFERDSLVVRGGYNMAWTMGSDRQVFRPYAAITYERELENDPVMVTAGSNTMPGRFTLSGLEPSRHWVRTDLGVSGSLSDGVQAHAGYSGRFGSSSHRDHLLTLGLRVVF